MVLVFLLAQVIGYNSLLDSAFIVGELDVYLGQISADTSHPKSIMNRKSVV